MQETSLPWISRQLCGKQVALVIGCAALLCSVPRESFAQASSSASGSDPKPTRMDLANQCLARGDNECVIRALEGWARTQQELGLLIETYRALRQDERAQQVMRAYIERFPNASRTIGYRRMLEQAGKSPPPTAADKKPAPKRP